MSTAVQLRDELARGSLDRVMSGLYRPGSLSGERARYGGLLERFASDYPELRGAPVGLYSAPGRTEVGGNHTDHNAGRVLAAAVSLDALAVAAPTADGAVRVRSRGYPDARVDVSELDRRPGENHTPASVVRGIAARMRELGYRVGGFAASVDSSVPDGSGLSSSASFEVLVATILSHLYNGGSIDPLVCAQIGQYAENVYFGKPCGLMDQTTSAVGGVVTIDFKDASKPVVKKLVFDFAAHGLSLVVVNTGGSHSDLTPEYAAIRSEMESVARELGGKVLRDVDPERFRRSIPQLRGRVGDRAILRAMHFYGDNERVLDQVRALEGGDLRAFLSLVVESGRSSWTLNQNCAASSHPESQPIPLALAVSERLLAGRGAWRVHGGGFAGTIQAFVPDALLPAYLAEMRRLFGEACCQELAIRSSGAVAVRAAG
jgi:galactokinase